jgi:hypothetical protein
MAVVYKHTRLDKNEVFYVGIGKTEKRSTSKHNRNQMWWNIINKTEIGIEILSNDLTWNEACDIEKYLIAYYGRRDLGLGTLVNMTDGGEGLVNLSKESKLKMSQTWIGRKHKQESKDKIREKVKGNKNMLGKKHSEITRELIGKYNIGTKRNCKIIVDLETGIFYDTIKDLSNLLNKEYKQFHRELNSGKYKNKYNII